MADQLGNQRSVRVSDGSATEALAGYSRAVRRGSRIEVSGTTANAEDGAALHAADTGAQVAAALARVVAAVEQLGGTVDDVVRTRMYLAPGADWHAASIAHAAVFGEVLPANTTLYVQSLIGDGYLVEIEAEAEVL